MPRPGACLWRRVEATQPGRVPTHFGPATRLRRPESPWNQGALATSQVEMCPRTANSGQALGLGPQAPPGRLPGVQPQQASPELPEVGAQVHALDLARRVELLV